MSLEEIYVVWKHHLRVYICVCVESFLQNMFLEGMCRDKQQRLKKRMGYYSATKKPEKIT